MGPAHSAGPAFATLRVAQSRISDHSSLVETGMAALERRVFDKQSFVHLGLPTAVRLF
jgi:hypothetical protein